jgi:hypothetical protein
LISFSNFSSKKRNEILQFLSSTFPVFFDFSPLLQLLQFLLSNLLSCTMLPQCKKKWALENYQFSSLICLSSCGVQFLEGLVFVCVCVCFLGIVFVQIGNF